MNRYVFVSIGLGILMRETLIHHLLYINDKFAEKINYNKLQSDLECIDINTKKKFLYSAKNIFICCGPISTAALLFRSNLVKSDKIIFKESQRFFLPIFNKKNINNSVNQNKNTLSEIYLEIRFFFNSLKLR